MDQFIPIVIVLFILSLITERIANFLKLNIPEIPDDKKMLGFIPGGPLRTKSEDKDCEKIRERRIMFIAVMCGLLVSFLFKADIFLMIKNLAKANEAMGWDNEHFKHPEKRSWLFIPGCMLTALFISMGSKFWHDLLDLLYETKNYKRVLADPETYKYDKVQLIEKALNTYQSDFIRAAFLEAQPKFMAISEVKSFSLKQDSEGYYFAVTLSKHSDKIAPFYQYLLEGNTPVTVRVKVRIMNPGEKIRLLTLNLGGAIFNSDTSDDFGTVGCLVKSIHTADKNNYILTCCHTILDTVQKATDFKPNTISVGTSDQQINPAGMTMKVLRTNEIDGALVQLTAGHFEKINNQVPRRGKPKEPVDISSDDVNTLRAYLYGAASKGKNSSGFVTSCYCSAEIDCVDGPFTMTSLIAISNNGVAVAEGGDSGSLVLNDKNNIIGMVVAGNDEETYIVPLSRMLAAFEVKLA